MLINEIKNLKEYNKDDDVIKNIIEKIKTQQLARKNTYEISDDNVNWLSSISNYFQKEGFTCNIRTEQVYKYFPHYQTKKFLFWSYQEFNFKKLDNSFTLKISW